MSRLKDMTGQRFGMLTVLRRSEQPHSRVYWICQCDCGRVIEVAGNNLKRGHHTSCGCRRVSPYIGKRFGHLVVLEKTEETVQHGSTKSPLWKCRCDCGNTVLLRLDSITSGQIKSCGCQEHEGKTQKMRDAAGFMAGTQLSKIQNISPTSANSSGVVGVSFDKKSGKWDARLTFQGKRHYLGRYNTLAEAAAARKKAEQEWFGSFLESLNEKETELK